MYRPRTSWEWTFLSIVVLQALTITALEGFFLVDYRKSIEPIISAIESASLIPVTIGLVTFHCFCQIALAIDGLRSKNNIQLFTLCAFNGCIFLITFLQYMQVHEAVQTSNADPSVGPEAYVWQSARPVLLAMIVGVGVCSAALPLVTFYLHQAFAWDIYKHISANLDVRRRHIQYQLYLVAAKFCVCVTAGFLFIYGFVEVGPGELELAVTMFLVPVVVFKPLLAIYFIKHEVAVGTICMVILHVAEIGYLLSRVAAVAGKSEQSAANDSIILFAVAALFCTAVTLATAVQCFRNFGHGLKPLLLARRRSEGNESLTRPETSWDFSQSELRLVRRFSMD